MKKKSIFTVAYTEVRRPIVLIATLLLGIVLSALYPSDLASYPILPAGANVPTEVTLTENYIRFVPTAVQIALPLILGDKVGLVQLLYVGISNTIATHGMKYFLNNRRILGTRLGQRPSGPSSKHNIPSGHSSMSSCAVFFVARRYSIWLGLLLSIILLLTLYARVMLNAHTISAVIAGTLTGILTTALFTSQWRRDVKTQQRKNDEARVDDGEPGLENALRANPLDVHEQYERQIKELQEAYDEATGD